MRLPVASGKRWACGVCTRHPSRCRNLPSRLTVRRICVPAIAKANTVVPRSHPSAVVIVAASAAPLGVTERTAGIEAAACVGLHDGSVKVVEASEGNRAPEYWTLEGEPDAS